MASDRLTTRAFAGSTGIGGVRACDPDPIELGFRVRALTFGQSPLPFCSSEDSAILVRGRLFLLARLALAHAAQVDDLAHARFPYFLRKASIETTLASPACAGAFSGDLSAFA